MMMQPIKIFFLQFMQIISHIFIKWNGGKASIRQPVEPL
jgi:hypothetical protein